MRKILLCKFVDRPRKAIVTVDMHHQLKQPDSTCSLVVLLPTKGRQEKSTPADSFYLSVNYSVNNTLQPAACSLQPLGLSHFPAEIVSLIWTHVALSMLYKHSFIVSCRQHNGPQPDDNRDVFNRIRCL